MTRRAPSELYAAARTAGLSVPSAVISTAIALAESGGDDTELGDQNLETGDWGPSVGAWQIRTLKSQTGTGQDRDITALQGDLTRQAQAMDDISSGGAYWQPWTTYNTGAYKQFLTPAQQAATSSGTTVSQAQASAGAGGNAAPAGNPLDPFNISGLVSSALAGILGQAIAPARALALKASVVVLGLGLVGFGLYRSVSGGRRAGAELRAERDQAQGAAGALL